MDGIDGLHEAIQKRISAGELRPGAGVELFRALSADASKLSPAGADALLAGKLAESGDTYLAPRPAAKEKEAIQPDPKVGTRERLIQSGRAFEDGTGRLRYRLG